MHQDMRGLPRQGCQSVAHGILTFRAAGHGGPAQAQVLVPEELLQTPAFFLQTGWRKDKNKARHGPGAGQRAG